MAARTHAVGHYQTEVRVCNNIYLLSGILVQPFVPWRTLGPSTSMAVAGLEMLVGAAVIAGAFSATLGTP